MKDHVQPVAQAGQGPVHRKDIAWNGPARRDLEVGPGDGAGDVHPHRLGAM